MELRQSVAYRFAPRRAAECSGRQFSYKDARDTVVLAVGANYLLTIAAESRVAAVQAEVTTAQALYQLALDQENAGLAPKSTPCARACSCRRNSRP